jgi:hypothetical protein
LLSFTAADHTDMSEWTAVMATGVDRQARATGTTGGTVAASSCTAATTADGELVLGLAITSGTNAAIIYFNGAYEIAFQGGNGHLW